MKANLIGTLELSYKENKYISFENFIFVKEKIDLFFEDNEIKLKKKPVNPTPRFNAAFYDFSFEYMSKKHNKFLEFINELGLCNTWFYYLDFEFTKKEKNESPLFLVRMFPDFYATGIKHPSEYGTKYEKTFICPKCGATKFSQLGPLFWDTRQMKKRYVVEIPARRHIGGHAIIISEKLKNILEQEKISGYYLKPVNNVSSNINLPKCYQLFINNILPPLSKKMPLVYYVENCAECRKYGQLAYPLHYDKNLLTDLKDFNIASEEQLSPEFQPRVLFSRKLIDLFKILKIKMPAKPIILVE